MGRTERPVFACRLDMRPHMPHAAVAATLLGVVDTPIGDPWGRPQELFSGRIPAVPPGRRGCDASV